ncbi:MAG: hypothetical protein ACRBFS_05015 [Aureispira sp.]
MAVVFQLWLLKVNFEEGKSTYTRSPKVEIVFVQTAAYLNQHLAKILTIETAAIDVEKVSSRIKRDD